MNNNTNDRFFKHITDKRHIIFNTPEYDDWLDFLLQFDTSNIPIEYLWVNCDRYFLYLAKQGSDAWKKARISRVTGSVLAEACSVNKYSNNTNTDLINVGLEINGLKNKTFSDFAINVAMPHGNKTEHLIRSLHSKFYNIPILELPIAIPVDNLNIGVSIDAYLKYNDIIGEYKSPQKMYQNLTDHIITKNMIEENGYVYDYNYNHILINHYYQMHLGMYIFNKNFCDYMVCDYVKTKSYYLEKIPFDNIVWSNISKQLNIFIDNILLQQRKDNNIELLCPPRQI